MKILYINPEVNEELFVAILDEKGLVKNLPADGDVGLNEQLLSKIDNLLKSADISKTDLTKIAVSCSGGTFSSLRTAIVTANALAFALNIPVVSVKKNSSATKIVEQCSNSIEQAFKPVFPVYDSEPNITTKK